MKAKAALLSVPLAGEHKVERRSYCQDLSEEVEYDSFVRRCHTGAIEEIKRTNSVRLEEDLIIVQKGNGALTKATDETYESLRRHAKSRGIEFQLQKLEKLDILSVSCAYTIDRFAEANNFSEVQFLSHNLGLVPHA